MGLLDALLGRSKPVPANLDKLFGLPGAAITLQASETLAATGQAAVCFKPAVGPAFADAEKELVALLQLDDEPDPSARPSGEALPAIPKADRVRLEPTDQYGYRWVVIASGDFDSLVTKVHFVNSTLRDHGYGPQLLCSVFGFAPAGQAGATTYLVYLYKRGTFYPFVPLPGERRDNESELTLRELLHDDLSIEPDLDRWFPLWGLPVR